MADLPILYSFRRCPYAIRARLALLQAGVAVELREVDLRHKPPELLACSPVATVPVLDLGAGQVLTQSLDILRWALAHHDPQGWLTRGNAARDQRLIAVTDGEFKRWLDRTKYAERFPEQGVEVYRAAAERCLIEPLDAALGATGYLGGDGPNWADAAIFPFVRQFAAVEADLWSASPWVATRRWLDNWLGSALFATCMLKQPVWRSGAPGPRWPAA